MWSRQCPFCENANPPNARFCNACGVKLQAALCPRCGAVNLVSATVCVQCAELLESPADAQPAVQGPQATNAVPAAAHAPPQQPAEALATQPVRATTVEPELPVAFWVHFDQDHTAKIDRYDLDAVRLGLSTGVAPAPANLPALTAAAAAAPQPALNGWTAHDTEAIARSVAATADQQSPSPAASAPLQLPRHTGLIATVVLGLLTGLTYFLYREHSKANMAAIVYAGGQSTSADSSGDADGAVRSPPASPVATMNAAVAADANVVAAVPATPAAFPPAPPAQPAANVRAPVEPSAAMRPQIGSKEAAAAVAAAMARPKATAANGDRQAQRFEPCTDAVAALGLCATTSSTAAKH